MAVKTHINNWISKAEHDYYTMFIKAWIPFNAWYFAEYSTKKDSVALKAIKNSKNKIRNRIEALLKNNDYESKIFRFNLAQLHLQLEKRSVINYDSIVSFRNIILEDYTPSPFTATDKKGNIYKALPDKNEGYRAVILTKAGKTLMDKTFNPYDFDSFLKENQYIALGDAKIQEKIKICFENINPKKPISIVSKSKIKSEYLILDNDLKIQFVNNTELIAKSLIEILYSLRCLLFHGEIDPTESNQGIYEYSFNILQTLIRELK